MDVNQVSIKMWTEGINQQFITDHVRTHGPASHNIMT